MTLFYAYAIRSVEDNAGRVVITFASRDVADEWWRAISLGGNALLSRNVQRVAPQFYAYNHNTVHLGEFFTNDKYKSTADPFRGKMFFTLESDRLGGANWGPPRGLSIIPPHDIVDHVSGKWFYIRSDSNQNLYWHYNAHQGVICTSTQNRTKFRISATNVPNGTIMIGTDTINIRVKDQRFVVPDGSGRLVVNQSPWSIEFGALRDGRISVSEETSELCFVDRDDSRCHESWVLA